jgi:hypothetical protein
MSRLSGLFLRMNLATSSGLGWVARVFVCFIIKLRLSLTWFLTMSRFPWIAIVPKPAWLPESQAAGLTA